jgi:ABC-type multidrug transport system permease subunit
MKTPVAVALILMGALMIMTSVLSENLYQSNLAALMSTPTGRGVQLRNQMGEFLQIVCWLTGTGMIAISIFCSLAKNSPSSTEN